MKSCFYLIALAMIGLLKHAQAIIKMAYLIDTSGTILQQSADILDHDTESINGSQRTLRTGNKVIRNGETLAITGLPQGETVTRIAARDSTVAHVFGGGVTSYEIDENGVVITDTNGIRDFTTTPFGPTSWTLYKINNFILRNNTMSIRINGLPEGMTLTRISAFDGNSAYVFAIPEPEHSITLLGLLAGALVLCRRGRFAGVKRECC